MKSFLFLGILLLTASANAQQAKYISLKQEHIAYIPKGFYIAAVIDDRADTTTIGTLTENGKKQKIALENGTANAFQSFITGNITQDKAAQPIVLHITKLEAKAKKAGGIWQADAELTLAFYVADKSLTTYSVKGSVQTDTLPENYVEEYIRKNIESDLKGFDTWWLANKGKYAVRPDVKVNVTIATTAKTPGDIIYSASRPLQISDFTGSPDNAVPEMASTYSGVEIVISGTTENSQVVVNYTISPLFTENRSWFKEAGKTPQVLAHEQTHFNITALKACELANTIRNTAFTRDNYKAVLKQLYEESVKQADEEQEQYDQETNHGIIRDKQLEWEQKIAAQIKAVGCY